MNTIQIINEISNYADSLFEIFTGTDEEKLNDLENKLKYKLPNDFKNFLLISNGISIYGREVYGIKEKKFEDLYGIYIEETEEVGNPMPKYLLPITPDGMGNHNCLDLSSLTSDGETCNVIFWQHDRLYNLNDEKDKPDIDAI